MRLLEQMHAQIAVRGDGCGESKAEGGGMRIGYRHTRASDVERGGTFAVTPKHGGCNGDERHPVASERRRPRATQLAAHALGARGVQLVDGVPLEGDGTHSRDGPGPGHPTTASQPT